MNLVDRRLLRILLFSSLYPSAERPGHGIFVETRLRELLSSGRVEARVVAPVPWFFSTNPLFGEYARVARIARREVHNGIDVRHPRYFLPPKVGMTMAPLALALGALPALRELLAEGYEFDLIDAHYYYPDGVAAALLASWLGKPLVITARGTDLNLIPRYHLPRMMMQWAARRAAASIGVCQALVDVLASWRLPHQRLHVIRNGVDLERFRPEPPVEARRRLGLPLDAPVLLSVGYLNERKGQQLIVEAMPAILERYPRARLVLIGEGPDRAALERCIAENGLGEAVRLTGSLPNAELPGWYSAADLLILASSREGWANVLLEALACGTPVAATRIWGTPEVVASPDAGVLFADRSAAAIAAGVVDLLGHPRDRAAVRRYAEKFGWQESTDAQLSLFTAILDGNGDA